MIPQWWRNVIHSPLCSPLADDETVAWPHISYKAVAAYPWINEFVNYTSYTLCISGKKVGKTTSEHASIWAEQNDYTSLLLSLECFTHYPVPQFICIYYCHMITRQDMTGFNQHFNYLRWTTHIHSEWTVDRDVPTTNVSYSWSCTASMY